MITIEQLEKWVDQEINSLGYYGLREDREALNEQSDIYAEVRSIGYTKRPMELCRRCASAALTASVPIEPGTDLSNITEVFTWSRQGIYTPLEVYLKLFPDKKPSVLERIMKLTKCIVLMGGPGSGKGTIAQKIVGEYYIKHLSTGDIVRAEMVKDSEPGRVVKDCLGKGLLVPDYVVTEMFKNYLMSFPMTMFILDGFPRTVSQAKQLKEILRAHGAAVSNIIYLDVPCSTMTERLINRARPDDAGVIEQRLSAFQTETLPAIEWMKDNFDCFTTVNGNRTPDEVYADAKKVIVF